MKQINFINRTWEQIKVSYKALKTRYRTVSWEYIEVLKGVYSGYFKVSKT
jgi:hypothetical protein